MVVHSFLGNVGASYCRESFRRWPQTVSYAPSVFRTAGSTSCDTHVPHTGAAMRWCTCGVVCGLHVEISLGSPQVVARNCLLAGANGQIQPTVVVGRPAGTDEVGGNNRLVFQQYTPVDV